MRSLLSQRLTKKYNRRQFLRYLGLAATTPLFVPRSRNQTPPPLLEFVWVGAVTPTSAWITAKLLNESSAVRLVVSRRVDLSDPIFSDFYFPPTVFDLS
jgi:hypothetical protein